MRRARAAIAGLVGLLLVALLVAWVARFRIATGAIDRRLAAAKVPSAYRVTRLGPFVERIEDVRLGDPAAPDLVARRIDVTLGYGVSGPVVRAIRAEGVRLRARIDADGLSLGAVDRLLPASSGGRTTLPDLGVTLRDVVLTLATPNGTLRAALAGDGNPRRRFTGTASVDAPALRLASCALNRVTAHVALDVRDGAPRATGPVRIGASRCPGVRVGAGTADLALSSDETLRRVAARARLDGFGGAAGPARFARLRGPVTAEGELGALALRANLAMDRLAFPGAVAALRGAGPVLPGTPAEPTATRARDAVARLLSDGAMTVALGAAIRGRDVDVRVDRLALAGRDGARITAVSRGGLFWTAAGWRADGDVASGGGALPALSLRLRQPAAGAALTATGSLSPYAAGPARLAASPLDLVWDKGRARFATRLAIDGPVVGDGFVRGLTLPLRGVATATGGFALDAGCVAVGFDALRLASFVFGGGSLRVCGDPIVARPAGGALRIDAATGPVALTGATTTGTPVALAAARLRATAQGVSADRLEARIGPPAQATRLAIARLDGRFRTGGIGGTFAATTARIANVPLDLADAAGAWTMAGGRLRVTGALMVSDAGPGPRFLPLRAEDATLALDGGAIAATARLVEPTTGVGIATVRLDHDLSRGAGHATLSVPGIRFSPKGLQPERLTPLTLGVVANVAGTIAGDGRIAWGPAGVTSTGAFRTDRIDLAAAFGPVAGLAGELRFTDLLGLVSAPHQRVTIAEINPGVVVADGIASYQLVGDNRVQVEGATWPFAGGTLRLEPSLLAFDTGSRRRLTFRVERLDAAAFVQQLDFPNIAATGTFDGALPMVFDQSGGRIEAGSITARPGGGTLAYVGELSDAALGTMGRLAFDALKAIRYSSLDISLDGRLEGEMVSRVRFTGVREATPGQSLVTRLIRDLPFRFNIAIRAPFRGLVGSARAYIDPRLLLSLPAAPPPAPVQPAASEPVR